MSPCVSMCVQVNCGGGKRAACGHAYLESSLGPLTEQYELLTTELSPDKTSFSCNLCYFSSLGRLDISDLQTSF